MTKAKGSPASESVVVGARYVLRGRVRAARAGGDSKRSDRHRGHLTFVDDRQPATYRSGPATLRLRWEGVSEDDIIGDPVVTVSMPGHGEAEVPTSAGLASAPVHAVVGRWEGGQSFVMIQGYTGGAHCCFVVQLVIPNAGALRLVDLGMHDGEGVDERPIDIDGDGRLDFVFRDNAFLYRFSSYADSFPPPQITNVIDGEAVDVSERPGFRRLFEEFMADARSACLDRGGPPNGACAGYVASAARLGRFDEAWTEMQRAHDRNSDWGLEYGCRVALAPSRLCPEGQKILHASYPDALRAFLVDQGYIAR